MRTLLPRVLIALTAVLLASLLQQGGPSEAATGIKIEPAVWQLGIDYSEDGPADSDLPIDTVYIKTHDATNWMAEFDDHPLAISGPAAVQNIINVYAGSGIRVAAWFVPKGSNYQQQVDMAVQVIDSGVTALYADLEPFQGFCYQDCHELAENFWFEVRERRPNAKLGVIYDPRIWWWEQSATAEWLTVADVALPMCYWNDYAGQVPYGDPGGCVAQAKADLQTLAPGRNLNYIPMLQGNTYSYTGSTAQMQKALDAAVRAGSESVSIWRRGTVHQEVWDMIEDYRGPTGPKCAIQLQDGCLIKEAFDPDVWFVAGGARFHMVSQQVLFGMGYDNRDVQIVPTGFIDELPPAPSDGTLIREYEDPEVYVVYGRARFWLVSLEVFQQLGFSFSNVRVIPPGGLDQIPLSPEDFVRFQEYSDTAEYVTIRGARVPLDEDGLAAFLQAGHNSERRFVLPDGGLNQVPIAQVQRGDGDCNGQVNVLDVLHTLMRSFGLPHPAICTNIAGDVTCDGLVQMDDALHVLLYLADIPGEAADGCVPVGESVPAALITPPFGDVGAPSPAPTPEPTDAPEVSAPPVPAPSESSQATPDAQTATPAASETPTPTPVASETPAPPPSPSPTETPTLSP